MELVKLVGKGVVEKYAWLGMMCDCVAKMFMGKNQVVVINSSDVRF